MCVETSTAMIVSLIQHISMRFVLILSYCIVIPYCSSLVHVTSGWWLVHIVSYLLLLAVKRSIYTSLWFEYTLRYISNKRYWHCNKEMFEGTKGVIRDRTRRQRGIIMDKRKNDIFLRYNNKYGYSILYSLSFCDSRLLITILASSSFHSN